MKIAFVTRSMSGGGVERVISTLANGLSKDKNNFVSIITIGNSQCAYELDKRINLKTVTTKVNVCGFRGIARVINLRNVLTKDNYDVVISFSANTNVFAIAACRLCCKIPIIVSERNDPNNDPSSSHMRKIRNIMYNFTDAIVFQTNDARDYFKKSISRKGVVIYNPLKVNLPDVYEGERENVITCAARLEAQKNLTMLIKAFSSFDKSYPDYKLYIYGEGSEREKLEQQVKSYGLENKVFLPGNVPDVTQRITKSKMFALSSDYEGLSNAMLEALAIGLPVVSTDHPIGGAKLFIRNGENGYLIKRNDANGMAEAFEKIARNTIDYGHLSEQAILLREELSIEKISKCWIDLIIKVAKKR